MGLSEKEQKHHLSKVSRSFAVCIERLDGPLRKWVGLSYLICRILDTIEDSSWEDLTDRNRCFETFDTVLTNCEKIESLNNWDSFFPCTVKDSEKALLIDAKKVFLELHRCPEPVKRIIQTFVKSMSDGMKGYVAQDNLKLKTVRQVNRYCMFVAGVVGEMLSNFVALVDKKYVLSPRNLKNAHHFGLFLQKVNILKDQFSDEMEGRFLVPSRKQVIGSLQLNACSALEYLKAVPLEHKGYRVFCGWSLFLGLASLAYITGAASQNEIKKISRFKTMKVFAEVEMSISDNNKLQDLFDKYYGKSGILENTAIAQSLNDEDVQNISNYYGDLTLDDLRDLEIV